MKQTDFKTLEKEIEELSFDEIHLIPSDEEIDTILSMYEDVHEYSTPVSIGY